MRTSIFFTVIVLVLSFRGSDTAPNFLAILTKAMEGFLNQGRETPGMEYHHGSLRSPASDEGNRCQ